jgi:hypothetical protein
MKAHQKAIHRPAARGSIPPRIADDVDHRREGPLHSLRAGLPPCDGCRCLDTPGIPTRGLSQRNGKDRAKSVDDVAAKYEGHTQTSLFDSHALQGIDGRGVDFVQNRADLSLTHQVEQIVIGAHSSASPVGSPPMPLSCHIWPIFSDSVIWLSIILPDCRRPRSESVNLDPRLQRAV